MHVLLNHINSAHGSMSSNLSHVMPHLMMNLLVTIDIDIYNLDLSGKSMLFHL